MHIHQLNKKTYTCKSRLLRHLLVCNYPPSPKPAGRGGAPEAGRAGGGRRRGRGSDAAPVAGRGGAGVGGVRLRVVCARVRAGGANRWGMKEYAECQDLGHSALVF